MASSWVAHLTHLCVCFRCAPDNGVPTERKPAMTLKMLTRHVDANPVVPAEVTILADEDTTRDAVTLFGLTCMNESPVSVYGYGIRNDARQTYRVVHAVDGVLLTGATAIAALRKVGVTAGTVVVEPEPFPETLPAGTYVVYADRS